MHSIFFALLILLNCYAQAQSPEDRSDTLDIIKYDVNLRVDQDSQSISGYTTVKLTPKFNMVNSISLDLLMLNIDSITHNNQNVSFSYNDTLIRISTSTFNIGDTLSYTIHYNGNPVKDNSGWGGFYWSGSYAYNLGVAFEASPHNYGRIWHPCFDNFKERAYYNINIRTAGDRMGTSNGLLIDTVNHSNGDITWQWSSSVPIPSYLACMHVADYTSVNYNFIGSERIIPVQLFARPSDTNNLKTAFQNLILNLEAFEYYYGPYQFDKVGYSLVPFTGGAMEHASNISYPVIMANSGLAYETLMAHELSHHWWGNLVTCDSKEEMWLNEGMASYSELLFLEYVYGKERMQEEFNKVLESVLHFAHVNDGQYRAIQGIPHEYTYSTHVYSKGALVAHTLRNYLGDSIYFPAISQFLLDSSLKAINSYSLQNYLEDFTNKDLDHFFEPWVFSKGFADFSIASWSSTQNNEKFDCKVKIHQRLNNAPDYYNKVPLEVCFIDESWSVHKRNVFLTGACGEYDFTMDFDPVMIVLDADHKIAGSCILDSKVINKSGFNNFPLLQLKVKIDNVTDSSFIYIEHHYSPPEKFKSPIKNVHLSQYRYWKISGDSKGLLEGYLDFSFDGSLSTTNGYLDEKLITNAEDSMLLLYRADDNDDWSIINDVQIYNLGSNMDGKGSIRTTEIKFGEFTLGIYDHDKQDSVINIPDNCINQTFIKKTNVQNTETVKVFPNPSKGHINITSKEHAIKSITCIDSSGKSVSIPLKRRHNKHYLLKLSKIAVGMYLLEIKLENGRTHKESVLISRN